MGTSIDEIVDTLADEMGDLVTGAMQAIAELGDTKTSRTEIERRMINEFEARSELAQ